MDLDPETNTETASPRGPSKSHVKREHLALQRLAEEMLALPRAELRALELGAATWLAIDETSRIKDLRALRRHYKRIANCLAREDTDPLRALLERREQVARTATARQYRLESWRERLIAAGDEAVGALLADYPGTDRQQLRALARAARRERELETVQPGGTARRDAARRLFRFLRDSLDTAE